jgi:hypothetical protein
MTRKSILRSMIAPRHMLVLVALVVPLALAAPAMAKEPTGVFSVFKQCPRFTTGVNYCLYAKIESGSVTIGKTTVPINEEGKTPIILQGGYERNETKRPVVEHFVGAINGETLSKTPQNVPGGLTDLVNCTSIKGEGLLKYLAELARAACKLVFENKTTGVAAVTELAKPASEIGISSDNLINEEEVALKLPAKIRLENTFLGSECYIGSSSEPVTLNLTTGTTSPPKPNEPIKGELISFNQFSFEGFPYIALEAKLVDNAFSVPKAQGCGGIFESIIDPIIDEKLELPSAAGKNTAIQIGTQKLATAEDVIKQEK